MIPQFSLNILFKHDQENLPSLMEELTSWCDEHRDTEIQFFDLGSHDDSRAIIEEWALSGKINASVKVVDVMDYSHFSQAVGLALRLSVGQVAWVGTPEDFPDSEELEKIFGQWNSGSEIIWGFKPTSISSGVFDPLLRRVERRYPQSFADQFFEQHQGAFLVCDRKVMITHNSMLTATSSWWRHVVSAGWSMDRWTLKNPIQISTRVNAPQTRLMDVLVLWLNQGQEPLRHLLYAFGGLGALAFLMGFAALFTGMTGHELRPLANSLVVLSAFAFAAQFASTGFVFLFLARRWDRSQVLEKPLRYQENNLLQSNPANLRGHTPIATPAPTSARATTGATVIPMSQASTYRQPIEAASARPATIIAPEETNVTAVAPEVEAVSSPVEVAEPPSDASPVSAKSVSTEPAEAETPLAPTQIPIMQISSKSS